MLGNFVPFKHVFSRLESSFTSMGIGRRIRPLMRSNRARIGISRIQSSRIESGWMSMRAPVSFAAKRAFCPSLPIASDSW